LKYREEEREREFQRVIDEMEYDEDE